MPKFLSNDQQSVEWLTARKGRITASRIKDVLAINKNGSESAKRYNYKMELIAERLTGCAADHYVNPAMEWGSENEPWAIAAFELAMDTQVERVGFAVHPALDYSGASVDGIVGSDGIIEAKCPTTVTHLEWMMAGVVPQEHRPQIYWGLACTERTMGHFISFDPRLPEGMRVFCPPPLKYDGAIVADIQEKVMAFHEEIEYAIAKLRAR